jgi:hypothetical protein
MICLNTGGASAHLTEQRGAVGDHPVAGREPRGHHAVAGTERPDLDALRAEVLGLHMHPDLLGAVGPRWTAAVGIRRPWLPWNMVATTVRGWRTTSWSSQSVGPGWVCRGESTLLGGSGSIRN